VQGLELDWTIVTWDADLRLRGSDWSFHSFRGAKWTDVLQLQSLPPATITVSAIAVPRPVDTHSMPNCAAVQTN
jgi:hypothetical protein